MKGDSANVGRNMRTALIPIRVEAGFTSNQREHEGDNMLAGLARLANGDRAGHCGHLLAERPISEEAFRSHLMQIERSSICPHWRSRASSCRNRA